MRSEISAERLSDLIGMVYDCVFAPDRWGATIDAIRLEFDFDDAVLGVGKWAEKCVGSYFVAGVDAPTAVRMSEHGAEPVIALWGGPARVQQFPLGEPIVLSQATDPSTWMRNAYFRDISRPAEFIDYVNICLMRDPVLVGGLTMGRGAAAGAIREAELAGLRLVAPHLRRAMTIGKLFDLKAVEVATFASVIEGFATGVLLIGEDLGIVHANAAALAMLRAGDPIRSLKGRLVLPHQAASRVLETALVQAVQDEAQLGHRGIAIPALRGDGQPCVLHVLPLRRGEIRPGLMQRAAVALFIAPGAAPRLPGDALTLLYDLTPAERRVFELICEGQTPAEIAGLLGIASSTVKTHLLRVFDKTGCRRQADLVKLAASFTLPLW